MLNSRAIGYQVQGPEFNTNTANSKENKEVYRYVVIRAKEQCSSQVETTLWIIR